jgi:hypothetical protein
MFCSDVKAMAALRIILRGGNDLDGEQTWRPEHNGMAAVAKYLPLRSRLGGKLRKSRPDDSAGKADAVGEETGMSTSQTAVIGARASKERHAEITSGRAISQQGLVATCKDLPTKGNRRRREGFGLSHEVI